MRLSQQQLNKFWRLWARAESEVLPISATRQERDALRHSVMFKSCGKTSLKLVNPTGDFDRLMAQVATMTGDYQEMSYWSVSGERRMCYMIEHCARQIGELVQSPKGWDYCRAIFDQAGLPASWMDIPETDLADTFKMLDTHRRRILKRDFGWVGERMGQPLGFRPDRSYKFTAGHLYYVDPDAVIQPAASA